jgi:hypothetical protein
MATSPSDPAQGRPGRLGARFTVVGGGEPSPEEVAAIAAALELQAGPAPEPPPVSRWRWSGRRWQAQPVNWRDPAAAAHPSRL